jgi:hypothetical protein
MTNRTTVFGGRRTYMTGFEITKEEWVVTIRTSGEQDITRTFATEMEADAEIDSIRQTLRDLDTL